MARSIEQLEDQVEQLEKQLLEAQKAASLGELISTTTHEFNNVLMTIMNYARMGVRHKDEPTRDKAFGKILAASERAAKITHTVLGMARNRSDEFEAVNLEQLIEETMFLLEREMSKYRISVDYDLAGVPPVRAIGNQIQQVLLNLLINARQAMQGGGSLVIRTVFDKSSGMVDLIVRDYGSGIEPEQLRTIFDAYYTTKDGPDESGKGGTGLGLNACHKIIKAHGGRIRVQSTVGKGTAFTIKLPFAKACESVSVTEIPLTELTADTQHLA